MQIYCGANTKTHPNVYADYTDDVMRGVEASVVKGPTDDTVEITITSAKKTSSTTTKKKTTTTKKNAVKTSLAKYSSSSKAAHSKAVAKSKSLSKSTSLSKSKSISKSKSLSKSKSISKSKSASRAKASSKAKAKVKLAAKKKSQSRSRYSLECTRHVADHNERSFFSATTKKHKRALPSQAAHNMRARPIAV